MPIIDELPDTDWPGMTHREATAALLAHDWSLCGIGHWAVALRSPSGRLAARVCPFDPAYDVYVDLCRSRPGDPFLPRIDAHLHLDGGARLTIMEHLLPATDAIAHDITAQWTNGGDDRLTELRVAADAMAADASTRIPWFDSTDLNAGNIMTTGERRPVIVDVFCMDGRALYGALLDDPASVAAAFPAEERRHLVDIAFIAAHSTVAEIAALRAAAAMLDVATAS